MIDGSSAENPTRMTKFAAHATMSRAHTTTYGGTVIPRFTVSIRTIATFSKLRRQHLNVGLPSRVRLA